MKTQIYILFIFHRLKDIKDFFLTIKKILNIVKKPNIKIYDIDIVLQDHDPLDNYPFRFQTFMRRVTKNC